MSTEQPEASGSTPTRRNYHLNTFVFDSATLPKESYVKLIEQDGVIHKIVQRLMEKTQGKDDLRLSVVITASPATVCSRKQQHIEEFTSPNTFLTSLPRLAAKFPRDGSGLVKDLEWPGFGKGEAIVNEKGEVNYLLNGLIVGVEMLESSTYSMVPRSPPTSWSNITPSPGQSVLQTVYTPPFMSSTVSSSQHRNLIVVTGSSSQHLDQLESNGRRASYDETSWERLSDRVKRAGILCSKLTWTRPGYNDFGKPNPLGKLVNHAGDDQADDVWFSLPQEYQIHLVGFTIDKAPSPPAGTNDTPTLSAPTPNAAVLQTTDANKNQLLAQQQALRAIYSQASRASNTSNQNGKPTIDQNVLQNIMTAAKNGHLDLTNPALQQFKQMVMLQQQQAQMRNAQQAAAASQAGGQSSSGPPGGTNGTGEALAPNMDQMVQQAVRQQQTVQQQPGYGQGHNGAGMGNNVLQQQPAQPSQPQAQPPQATPQQLQQMQQIYQQRQQQQQQEQQQQQQQQLQQHQQQLQQNQMPQQQPQRNQQTPQIPQAQILPDRSEHQQAPPQPQHQNQQIQQPQVQQPQQMQPPPQQPQQMQRQQQPKPEKLWTGSLVLNLAPNNIYAMLVDAYPFNMSAGSNYQLEHWPADCKIAHMTQMATADLHAYQRAHTLPVILFSAASTGEGSNAQRYQQFVFNLGAKSNMAVIQFGTSDRGILLFTTSSTSGNGPRLMGLVCVVGHKNPLGMSGLINQEAPLPVQARTQLAGVQSQPQQPQTTQQPNQQQIQQQQVLQQPSFQQPPHQTMAALPQLPAGMTPQQVQQIQAARQSSQRAQQPSQQQQQQLQQRQAAAAAAQAQAQAQAQVQAVAQAQAQAQQKLQGQSYQQQYSQQLQQQQAIQQQQLNYQQSQPQSVQQYQQQQQPQQQQQMAQPQSQVQQGFQYGQPPVNRQQAMDALNHFAGQMTSTQSQNQPLPTMSQHGQQNAGRAQSQAVQIDGRAYAKLLESARKYDIKLPSHAEIKGINQDQLSQIIAVIKNAEATSNNKAAQQQIQQQLQQQAAQQRQQQVQQQQQQQQQQHQQRQQNPQLPQMPPPQQMSDLSQQNNGLGQMGQMSQMAQMAQMGQFNPAMMNQLGMQNQMAMQGQQGYGQQMQSGQYGMNMPMGIQQGQGQGQSQGQGQQGMGYNAMGSMGMQGQYMQQQ